MADPIRRARRQEANRVYEAAKRARDPESNRASSRRYYSRLCQDPARREAMTVDIRIARRERKMRAGGEPARVPKRPTVGGYAPVTYAGKTAKGEYVPAGPLRRFIEETFPGWETERIAAFANHSISPRLIYNLFCGTDHIHIDTADRFLTCGLGRPDLLNYLYPIDE